MENLFETSSAAVTDVTEAEKITPAVKETAAEPTPAPKKRGRPSKAEKEAQKAEKQTEKKTEDKYPRPLCREVKGKNPLDFAIKIEDSEGKEVPYLRVSDRIMWFHRYCEENKIVAKVDSEIVPECSGQNQITLKATIQMGENVYFGYGSSLFTGEGLQGSEIESAETRALGRALRNAGFITPYDLTEEKTPVDTGASFTNQNIQPDKPDKAKPIAPSAPPKPKKEGEGKTPQNQVETLVKALKQKYPYKPFPNVPVYQLLEQPQLKTGLEFIKNSNVKNENLKKWASFLLESLYNSENRDIYIEARILLGEEGLLKI